ncbi:phosphoenolpyruvate carboxylase, partial [Mycobacterium tuberculosis]|nr:phosphoenolpyruvate carboxylase [Mycobacterium tuberculosis]
SYYRATFLDELPALYGDIEAALAEHGLSARVPAFFQMGSWIGGDRDGNPNVTADITRHVLLLSRWKATDLFLKDVQVLISELSMVECTDELRALAGAEG